MAAKKYATIIFKIKKLVVMEVICLEEQAFYALMEKVVDWLKQAHTEKDKWIDDEEAMRILCIKSKTTLQKLRDQGLIRFTQPQKKIILYDRDSIDAYLEKNSQATF